MVFGLYAAEKGHGARVGGADTGLVRARNGIVSYSRSYRLSIRELREYVSRGLAIHPTYGRNRYEGN